MQRALVDEQVVVLRLVGAGLGLDDLHVLEDVADDAVVLRTVLRRLHDALRLVDLDPELVSREQFVAVHDVPLHLAVLRRVVGPGAVPRRHGDLVPADRHLQRRPADHAHRVVRDLRGRRIAVLERRRRLADLGDGREVEVVEALALGVSAQSRRDVRLVDRQREPVVRLLGVHRLERERTRRDGPLERRGHLRRLVVRGVEVERHARRVLADVLRDVPRQVRRHAGRHARQRHAVLLPVVHPRRRVRRDVPLDVPRILRLRDGEVTLDLLDVVVALLRACLERVGERVLARSRERLRSRHGVGRTLLPDESVAADHHRTVHERLSVVGATRRTRGQHHLALQNQPRGRALALEVAVRLHRQRIRPRVRRVLARQRVGDRQTLVCDRRHRNRLHRAVVLRIHAECEDEVAILAGGDIGLGDIDPSVGDGVGHVEVLVRVREVGRLEAHLRLAGVGARHLVRSAEGRLRRDVVELILGRDVVAARRVLLAVIRRRDGLALDRHRHGTLRHREKSRIQRHRVVVRHVLRAVLHDPNRLDLVRDLAVLARTVLGRRHLARLLERHHQLLARLEDVQVRRVVLVQLVRRRVIRPRLAPRRHADLRRALGDGDRPVHRRNRVVRELGVRPRNDRERCARLSRLGTRGEVPVHERLTRR